MSAHLTPPEQSRLIARTLAPDQWQGCLAHLGACATCRATVQRLRNQTMSLNPAIEPATTWATEWTPAHLEYEQLAGYVTRRLEGVEREIADNHLAVCEFCSVELQELAALHHDLRTLPVNAAVAPASQSQPFIQPQPLIAWLANFKERFAWPGGLALAGALCLLLLSFGIWGLWHRSGESNLAQQPAAAPSVAMPEKPPTPAESLLALTDHGLAVTLRQDGSLDTSLPLTAAYRETLAATLTNQHFKLPPVLKALAQPPHTLKGDAPTAPAFTVLSPLGRVLENDRPVFRWQPLASASAYTVAIFDENFQPIQNSGPLAQTNWQAAQALPRGRVLLWQVTAQVGDKQFTAPAAPAPEARFQILAQAQAAELQRARREFSQSHLLLGTLYAQAGLLDEAARELQSLQAENPQSPLIKKLLQQVRQVR